MRKWFSHKKNKGYVFGGKIFLTQKFFDQLEGALMFGGKLSLWIEPRVFDDVLGGY
jgi:hypothetical protein